MSYYKFRECNEANFNALENQCIYFSSMAKLNDPFEGKFTKDERLLDNLKQKIQRRYVYCLSEGYDSFIRGNHLMWTHYADGHKGFCIEYNSRILEGFKPYDIVQNIQENVWMKVLYTKAAPDTILAEDDAERLIADVLKCKPKQYEYENEVRLVSHSSDILEGYTRPTNDAITHIYLGCNIESKDKERLLQIANKLKIPCSQMRIDNGSYTLSCDLIANPASAGKELFVRIIEHIDS